MDRPEFFEQAGMWGIPLIPLTLCGPMNAATKHPLLGTGHPTDPIRLINGESIGQTLVWTGNRWELGNGGGGIDRFKGLYNDLVALFAAHPAGQAGDYAIVRQDGTSDMFLSWDEGEGSWYPVGFVAPKTWKGADFNNVEAGGWIRPINDNGTASMHLALQRYVHQSNAEIAVQAISDGQEIFMGGIHELRSDLNDVTLTLPSSSTYWPGIIQVIGGEGANRRIVRVAKNAPQTYNGFASAGPLGVDEPITDDGTHYSFELPAGKSYTFMHIESAGAYYVIGKVSPELSTADLGVYQNNAAAAADGVAVGSPYLYDNGDTYLLAFRK